MGLKDNPTLGELGNVFINRIMPLLQEYFYDDWEKIRLVLGDNNKKEEKYKFIKIKDNKDYSFEKLFGNNIDEHIDIQEDTKIFEINKKAFYKEESYLQIYTIVE